MDRRIKEEQHFESQPARSTDEIEKIFQEISDNLSCILDNKRIDRQTKIKATLDAISRIRRATIMQLNALDDLLGLPRTITPKDERRVARHSMVNER